MIRVFGVMMAAIEKRLPKEVAERVMSKGSLRFFEVAHAVGLPWKIFGDEIEDPYMLRIHLTPESRWFRKRLPGLALNYFFRGDDDREYHNHPWRWCVSWVLTRGYREFRKDGRYAPIREFFLRPGSFNFIWHDTFHRVITGGEGDGPKGVWTLFLMAPRDAPDGEPSDWGFVSEDGAEYEHQWDREQRVKLERENERRRREWTISRETARDGEESLRGEK